VHWVVDGAITLGAGSTAIGKMEASAAITVGASATCGDLIAAAAITVGTGAVYGSVASTSGAAITLGAGAHEADAVPPLAAELGGLTLVPGVYTGTAATGLTGTLYLDADETGEWIFKIGAAFSTAAASEMVFVRGSDKKRVTDSAIINALSGRVNWVVNGAITLGAGSTAIGKMAATGAITVGASATCDALVATGAITVGAGATALSVKSTTGAAVTMGAGAFVVGY
jgi:hypothetical protein